MENVSTRFSWKVGQNQLLDSSWFNILCVLTHVNWLEFYLFPPSAIKITSIKFGMLCVMPGMITWDDGGRVIYKQHVAFQK